MIRKNIQIIEDKISQICLKTGRDRSEITLIAVSKTMPLDIIKEVLSEGLIHLGENKAQEFRDKSSAIFEPVVWHFIGHLQTNKVKYVVDSADFIHSLDSEKLAAEINCRAEKVGKIQKVLLEVNTSGEESKYGLGNIEEISRLLEYCNKTPHIEPVGLMTMAPYTDDIDVVRRCFANLRETKEKLNRLGFSLNELSMGMTNDFEIAIEEGATMLRVGTAIFGERNYIKQG